MMQAARVAVKLEETMLTMKRLHGERWNEVAEPYRAVLRGVMKDSSTDNVLGVALQIAKGMDAKGVSPTMLMAVAAEMASTENTAVTVPPLAADKVDELVGDAVNLGDWRLIEDKFPGKVIALHENGSIRVRLQDGRELDGWPERTKPIPNTRITDSGKV